MNSLSSRYHHPAHFASHGARRACRGFNLVELVVVITIISILASVAVPSFTGMITRMKAQGTASDLHMALMKTRSEAIKRNANVKFAIASGGKGWSIYPTAAEGNVLESYTVSGNVSISGAGSVEYNSSGRIAGVVSFGIKAVMGSESAERCVSTSLSGLPKVKKSAC
jgi:type IV fimbrial biogenesis protein FimT